MRKTGIAVSCPIRRSAMAATISERSCQQLTCVPHASTQDTGLPVFLVSGHTVDVHHVSMLGRNTLFPHMIFRTWKTAVLRTDTAFMIR